MNKLKIDISMSLDKNEFRRCMGHFATGITVVTTNTKENKPCGMTVNSFSSLSLEPPLILFSVDKNAHNHDNFTNCKKFAVNILSENQKDISVAFAHPSSVNWNEIKHKEAENGSPILKGCLAYISCINENIYAGGDHSIIIGRVTDMQMSLDEQPLIYFKGKYRKVGDIL